MPTTDRRARRLAIVRRRQRIAAHPREGDVVITREGECLAVAEVRDWGVWWYSGYDWRSLVRPLGYDRHYWREEVRRARVTQEGPA